MALPPLLSQEQYEHRAGRSDRPLDGPELDQFTAFTADASALVRGVAGQEFMAGDPPVLSVPEGILPVAFRVIDRAMENRLGLASETTGPYTWRKEGNRAGVYLDSVDRTEILTAIGRQTAAAVPLVSPWSGD